MKPINILDSYGLTNGLANFFRANHSVLVERNPYVSSIIRVTIQQTTNTPGVMTPPIDVKPCNRYRLTVTGYTTQDTAAFIAIMDDEVHRAVDTPVYLKCENRDIVLEFSTGKTVDMIKVFIVVAEPKLRQKFYISDIKLVDLGPVREIVPVVSIPTEPPTMECPEEEAELPVIPELLETPAHKEDCAPAKSEDLSNLLGAFHTYNKRNQSLNLTDNSLTPVVIKSHAVELATQLDIAEDDCDCDGWVEPPPCIMNVYNNSFSMNCFNPPMMMPHGNMQAVVPTQPTPTKEAIANIQLENIQLGIRVVQKQIRLLKVYSKHLDRLNELITESYSSLMGETERDEDDLKQQLTNILTEINFVSLATETEVKIFTPHNDVHKMPALTIDCRGKTISSTEYNVKIERYELGTRVNEIDDFFTLLFTKTDSENGWKINHDTAYSRVDTIRKNVARYHKTAVAQCDTLTNRKEVLD